MADSDGGERDRLQRDFIAEAEEILDSLSEDLVLLERAHADGSSAAGPIHRVFRRIHSLKGFAGSLEVPAVSRLAHALEDLLARLRLGRALDPSILDLVQETGDVLAAQVRALRAGGAPGDAADLCDRLRRAAALLPVSDGAAYALPDDVVAALTEEEEARLRDCAMRGLRLAFVRVRPDPGSLEEDLRAVARAIAGVGDLIATLPVTGEAAEDGLAFDLLVASIGSLDVSVFPVGLRVTTRPAADPPAPVGADPAPRDGATMSTDPADLEDLAAPAATLRVAVARLDEVMAQVGDLTVAFAALERGVRDLKTEHPRDRAVRELARLASSIPRHLRALQRGAVSARLVPLEQVYGKVARAAARVARAAGREVDLETRGSDTEIDKAVMDALTPSLLHLVANAVDHGLEPSDERVRKGKPPRGRVRIDARRQGPSVVIEISDDGRGLDLDAIRRAAVTRGLWDAATPMSADEARDLIFRPGFSTASRITEISGRGVGMDVVRRSIASLKGSIEVRSGAGQGTTFRITVPISLALVGAIVVRLDRERYAVPVTAVRESFRIEPDRLERTAAGDTYRRADGPLPLLRLERLLDRNASSASDLAGRHAFVAAASGRPAAIVCDAIVGRQDVVVKPLGRLLRDLPGLAGAADLGDARAVLVLDPAGLIDAWEGTRAA